VELSFKTNGKAKAGTKEKILKYRKRN